MPQSNLGTYSMQYPNTRSRVPVKFIVEAVLMIMTGVECASSDMMWWYVSSGDAA